MLGSLGATPSSGGDTSMAARGLPRISRQAPGARHLDEPFQRSPTLWQSRRSTTGFTLIPRLVPKPWQRVGVVGADHSTHVPCSTTSPPSYEARCETVANRAGGGEHAH